MALCTKNASKTLIRPKDDVMRRTAVNNRTWCKRIPPNWQSSRYLCRETMLVYGWNQLNPMTVCYVWKWNSTWVRVMGIVRKWSLATLLTNKVRFQAPTWRRYNRQQAGQHVLTKLSRSDLIPRPIHINHDLWLRKPDCHNSSCCRRLIMHK